MGTLSQLADLLEHQLAAYQYGCCYWFGLVIDDLKRCWPSQARNFIATRMRRDGVSVTWQGPKTSRALYFTVSYVPYYQSSSNTDLTYTSVCDGNRCAFSSRQEATLALTFELGRVFNQEESFTAVKALKKLYGYAGSVGPTS